MSGTSATTDAASSEVLKDRVEQLRLAREAQQLEQQLRVGDLASRLVREGWGDTVNRSDWLQDEPHQQLLGREYLSQPSDKASGDNFPHWSTEIEHAQHRGLSRVLATTDEVAIGALENLANYTIGFGIEISCDAKDQSPRSAELAAWCQDVVTATLEANGWEGDLEREDFIRSRRDGESLLGLTLARGRDVELRLIDASFVTEPDSPRDLEDFLGLESVDWKYGIATPHNQTDKTLGAFVSWYGDDNDWDFFPSDRLVHTKLNVDRETKRGMSDFFAVWRDLQRASKLLGNTLEGAAVQAAIAYIREHAEGVTSSDVTDWVAARAERTASENTPNGLKSRNIAKMRAGTVVDVTSGHKYHAGPLGAPRGQSYIEIVQAALRRAGIRWTMPEYMISGDASNGNFSSTLVAESPFTKATEARQQVYCRKRREMAWKIIALAAPVRGYDLAELKRHVAITADAPDVAVRNKLEDHQIRSDLADRGIVSPQTMASESGYDLDQEREKGAQARATQPALPLAESWRGYP